MEKVLIGLSGGVDSSSAAAVLKNQGFDVLGATLLLHSSENTKNDISDAEDVCEKLNIKHFTFDFTKDFKEKVESYFINSYKNGFTPNPCIICNKEVKFSSLLKKADELSCRFIATGHYSKIVNENGRMLLMRPKDRNKDQTYMLYRLNQEQLKRIKMPLADYTKDEIREIANSLGFKNANRPDSQDICFIPGGDYASFIRENSDFPIAEGNFLDISGNIIGRHKGVINYTVGQRKGLGVAFGKPVFVIEKNVAENSVVLGDEKYLFSKKVFIKDLNFIPFDELKGDLRVTAKLRYRHKEAKAVLKAIDKDTALIEFDEPQRAAAPGQSAVIYDNDVLIGGGIII